MGIEFILSNISDNCRDYYPWFLVLLGSNTMLDMVLSMHAHLYEVCLGKKGGSIHTEELMRSHYRHDFRLMEKGEGALKVLKEMLKYQFVEFPTFKAVYRKIVKHENKPFMYPQ